MVAAAFRGVGQGVVHRQGGLNHVVAQDVRQGDRLGRGRDVLGVQGREHGVLVEDVIELSLEARQLRLRQPEAGEVGDMLYIGTGQIGHGAG